MDKHTPEPWAFFETTNDGVDWLSVSAKGSPLGECHPVVCNVTDMASLNERDKANARRIVACVNACAGMDDPAEAIAAFRARAEKAEALLDRAILMTLRIYWPMGDEGQYVAKVQEIKALVGKGE